MKKPQNVVITGASLGIGRALAEIYAGDNVNLGLIGRSASRLEIVSELCRKKGTNVLIGVVDVTGSLKDRNTLEDLELVNKLINTNINGVINTIYPIIPLMQKRKYGQIAIVSSLASFIGMSITPAYCASKSAIKTYAEAIRGLLMKDNIRVSIICPGFVETELSDKFPGPKPFMIFASDAARIIQKGLFKNKPCIAFPFVVYLGIKILTLIPCCNLNRTNDPTIACYRSD